MSDRAKQLANSDDNVTKALVARLLQTMILRYGQELLTIIDRVEHDLEILEDYREGNI